jgi:hypothetical protein
VDSLLKLRKEIHWNVQWWPITKLTCRWFWMWCGNFKLSSLCSHFKNISVRPPPFHNTTDVFATSYLSMLSYLAYCHNKLYDSVWNNFFIDFQKNKMNNQNSHTLNATQKEFNQPCNLKTQSIPWKLHARGLYLKEDPQQH